MDQFGVRAWVFFPRLFFPGGLNTSFRDPFFWGMGTFGPQRMSLFWEPLGPHCVWGHWVAWGTPSINVSELSPQRGGLKRDIFPSGRNPPPPVDRKGSPPHHRAAQEGFLKG